MSYNHSAKNISELTGLPYRFILECAKEAPDVFEDVSTRGEKNSLLFNSNGLKMFEYVKTLKDKRMGMKAIVESLSELHVSTKKIEQSDSQTQENAQQTEEQTALYLELIDQLKQSHNDTLQAIQETVKTKEQTIQSKEQTIHSLEKQVLLLTDGRSPEEARREQEEQLQQREDIRIKRTELIQQIAAIDGHLFKAKQRKQLYKELQLLA